MNRKTPYLCGFWRFANAWLKNAIQGEKKMAFVKRKLTQDDILWLRSMKAPTFISGDYGACIVENVKKTIALVCLGGQGFMTEKGKYISDIPEVWLLIWNNHFVKIELFHAKKTVVDNKKVEAFFSIQKIVCEKSLIENSEEVLKAIKETLEVYGTDDPGVEFEDVHFLRVAVPVYVTDVW